MTPNITRILVPLDFSENSTRALNYARGLAVRTGASLLLVHVCEVPRISTGSMDAYAIAYTDWAGRFGAEVERDLKAVAATITDLPVKTEVLFGNAAASIIESAANNEADLIVMGTHGHGPVMHMVLGSVAERVVRGAPCPVLTVREPKPKEVEKTGAAKLAVPAAVK